MSKFVKVRIFENPLPGIEPRVERVRTGTLLKDVVSNCTAPMVCVVNGIPLKREYWMQRKVYKGDVIEFHAIYLGGGGGGGGSRSILAIVATIALAYFAPMMVASWGGAFTTTGAAGGALSILGRVVASGIVLLGNALISAVIMPQSTGGSASATQQERPSSIYNVDTQGNAAKIFSPIPVQYGRMKAYPDYASQPYADYKTTGTSGRAADGDQYYYALFCLGQGEYDVENIFIADTPITSFKDVLTSKILPPGTMPSVVNPTMIVSDAVSGQSLDHDGNKLNNALPRVGPFVTCAANRKVKRIHIDLVFPRGLYVKDLNSGKTNQASAPFDVIFQEIDNRGRPLLTATPIVHSISVTAASINA